MISAFVASRPANIRAWARRHWDLLAAGLLAVGVRIAFVIATGRVWEDALITVAHAKNAIGGLGLTHHAGEGPTHGFTSALSVLIPLGGEAVFPDTGVLALRLASLLAVLAALWFAWHLSRDLGLSAPGRWLVLGYLAIEQNHVFYGMAGMETQVAVAILLGGFRHAVAGNVTRTGVASGLAVLVRPEFIVLLVPFFLLSILMTRDWPATVRVAAIASVVVLPWAVFTTAYYGSPVPHTVLAKSASFSTLPGAGTPPEVVLAGLTDHIEPTLRSFMPFLADTLVATPPLPAALSAIVAGIFVVAAIVGLITIRGERRWWGLAGFLIMYASYRAILLPTSYYDWYIPPMTAVAILFAARGVDALATPSTLRIGIATALLAAFALPIPWLLGVERAVQTLAEDGVRLPVARYLDHHVRMGESVVAEAAGYIGSSGVLLWDFPGLTSPTAYGFVQQIPPDDRSVAALVATALPDWAVLRPREHEFLVEGWPEEAGAYQVCETIGSGGSEIEFNGLVKRSADLQFLVLRRGIC